MMVIGTEETVYSLRALHHVIIRFTGCIIPLVMFSGARECRQVFVNISGVLIGIVRSLTVVRGTHGKTGKGCAHQAKALKNIAPCQCTAGGYG